MKKLFNESIYEMYEEQVELNVQNQKIIKNLKLDNNYLKTELTKAKNKLEIEITKVTKLLQEEKEKCQRELELANKEIERLKNELGKMSYNVDKLECSVNKNSTNSGIPTSKEIVTSKQRTNTYNHREKSNKQSGGQHGHKGKTLTKKDIKRKIKENNIKEKVIVHYINGNNSQKDTIKYRISLDMKMSVEKHIFKHVKNSNEKLLKEFYSDVTYDNSLKSIIVMLGNYYSLSYGKIRELLYDFSNGVIDISEGTIDNIYNEFSNKTKDAIENIAKSLENGKYQHTDETVTKENGKDTYYRGYANKNSVLYKYHHKKGDKPIIEDNIITNFFGALISDHDLCIFKYGIKNQDCIIHIGRYCIEQIQNILETNWQRDILEFFLRTEKERQILKKFGKTNFEEDEIKLIEDEYDKILNMAEEQNKNISSKYWKEKANTFLKRLRRYKSSTLLFVYDFEIPYDNNHMERLLRIIKGKTKVSGGFRSSKGGERFGMIMSIIKTSKLRKLNPFETIKKIYNEEIVFA